jgi:hypothetical protein
MLLRRDSGLRFQSIAEEAGMVRGRYLVASPRGTQLIPAEQQSNIDAPLFCLAAPYRGMGVIRSDKRDLQVEALLQQFQVNTTLHPAHP